MVIQPTSPMAMHVIGFLLRIVSKAALSPLIHANVPCVPVSWAAAGVQPSGGTQELGQEPRAGGQQKQPHKFPAEMQTPLTAHRLSLLPWDPRWC